MAGRTALLLIDVLSGAFGREPLLTCDGVPVLPNIRRLLHRARAAGAFVVHVAEEFDQAKHLPGSVIWKAHQIHGDVVPQEGECVVRQQRYDPFFESGLHERLASEGVTIVVVAGISSPWCVDTAVRRAFGLGYRVILAADAHGSSDVGELPGPQVARHHNEVLAACFAEVRPVSEIVF